MATTPYRKDWLVSSGIARGLLGTEVGARIPTILEYCETFGCSRGVVQNALAALEQSGAVGLAKRGKQGTFLESKREEELFQRAGLSFVTGSMPTPLNLHLAGLATGICQAMARCPVPFTFAFVQGAKTRADALCREVYDFVVVTRAAAEEHMARCGDLEEAFELAGCEYSSPYMLFLAGAGLTEIQDGMSVAADPAGTDQWELTRLLCAGKRVELVKMPYVASYRAFLAGEVDAVVHRGDELPAQLELAPGFIPQPRRPAAETSRVPITQGHAADMQQPVVLVNRKNHGIKGILRHYLGGELVGYIQERVVDQQMAPQFY